MAIDRIKAKTLNIVADGKPIDIKVESKRNADLNKALLDPANFAEFAKNPKGFAARYDLNIDREISDQLVTKLHGIGSLKTLNRYINPIETTGATVWAVALGAFSVATSKVAVAF